MAITHVKVSRTTAVGADICEAINHYNAFVQLIKRSHAICDAARAAGLTPPDDSVHEALVGCNTGEGPSFFGFINSIVVALNDNTKTTADILSNIPKLDQGSGDNIS